MIITNIDLADEFLRENQKIKYLSTNKKITDNSVNAEKETWEIVKKSDKKNDYQFFIENFPESEYTIPAKLRIKQLESIQKK